MKMRKYVFLIFLLSVFLPVAAADNTDALCREADRLHAEGKNDSALIVAGKALDEARGSGDTLAMISVNSSMGVYLRTMGRLDEALSHYREAMEMCVTESFGRRRDEEAMQTAAALYLNLATLHVDMKQKKEAGDYARRAADYAARCADTELKVQVLSQAGLIFLMCGDDKEAGRLLSASYRQAVDAKLYPAALTAGAYMIAVADRGNDSDGLGEWRRRCRDLEGKVTDTMTLIAYNQILCNVALNHEDWHGAIALFEKILSTKGVDAMPYVVYDCYNNMHEAWAKLGRWQEAYRCMGKAEALKDSLFEKDKAENMRELTVKYQAKEKELALARSETELARTRMYVAVAVLLVVLLTVGWLLYTQAQRRKMRERKAEFDRLKAETDRRLTRRYLEGLESERARMAKELHDGVCNSLYTLQMMAGRVSPDGGAPWQQAGSLPARLDEIREQVRKVSHDLMPPEFKYADISIVLEDYVAGTAGVSGCDITYCAAPDDADWTCVPDDMALEVYRITQEAVTNAVKHSGATKVSVMLGMSDGKLTLDVTDNGTGIQQRGTRGIGRRTMRQRAEAVGGRITLTHEGGQTMLRVEVPMRDAD